LITWSSPLAQAALRTSAQLSALETPRCSGVAREAMLAAATACSKGIHVVACVGSQGARTCAARDAVAMCSTVKLPVAA
jgi:hypothetical protein